MRNILKATLIMAILFFSFIAYPPAIMFHNINGYAYAQTGQAAYRHLVNGLLLTKDTGWEKFVGTNAFKSMRIVVHKDKNYSVTSSHEMLINYTDQEGSSAKGKAKITMDGDFTIYSAMQGDYKVDINVLMTDEKGKGNVPFSTSLRGIWRGPEELEVGQRVTIEFEEAVGAPNPGCDNQRPVLDPFEVSFLVEEPLIQQKETPQEKQKEPLKEPLSEKQKERLKAWEETAGKAAAILDCFIATAAYGSETAEQLDTLRGFRDKVLMQSELGERLVNTYYAISPPLADYIRDKDVLRALVRVGLEPLVIQLNSTRFLWDN